MRFEIKCKNEGSSDSSAWTEPYVKNLGSIEEARIWAQGVIKHFNETIKGNEKKRVLLDVIVDEDSIDKHLEHDWEKSNLITIKQGHQLYDTYVCKRCNITGKRFGLEDEIERDKKFKDEVYEYCDTSMAKRGLPLAPIMKRITVPTPEPAPIPESVPIIEPVSKPVIPEPISVPESPEQVARLLIGVLRPLSKLQQPSLSLGDLMPRPIPEEKRVYCPHCRRGPIRDKRQIHSVQSKVHVGTYYRCPSCGCSFTIKVMPNV